MKAGDLVTIDKFCAPPELYGLGTIIEITHQHGGTGEPLRARVYWHGLNLRTKNGVYVEPGQSGCCAVRYLHKVEKIEG